MVVCFSALETADPMPPPRAKMSTFPCKRKHKRNQCNMCNVCGKCSSSSDRLMRHLARHLREPPAASDTHIKDKLQAAGLSTTTIAPLAAAMVGDLPAEAVEAAAACLGKSVYFLLCYFSFNILMRNESHFLIEMSPISHYLGITSH